ncbi:hypothetical protein DQ384_33105 [Sphaerisporangium album]|uniref:Uncharacterized protein n=1 Tax=Sphaerisporangium album TaxID=509200 RepID=A0A367F3N8_9ACTN|nr:hypothetical protein [Sphaerisporangium album]RCG24482.1 hypothetical protein DQ384_33105 [Sphaerisporangium album]
MSADRPRPGRPARDHRSLRWITATTVLAAALAVPATAMASARTAPATPVGTLARHLATGSGVKVTNRYTVASKGTKCDWREAGALRLGRSGVVASDLTGRYAAFPDRDLAEEQAKPRRFLTFPKADYSSGPFWEPYLPAGKTWVRLTDQQTAGPGLSTLVDIFEPGVYRGLLATTSVKRQGGKVGGASTTLYEGAIPYGKLYALSPSLHRPGWKPDRATAKVAVRWKLWLGTDKLARRLVTAYVLDKGFEYRWENVVDTRFSSWGAKVSITPPPAGEVIDYDDLGSDVPDGFTTMIPGMASRER